MALCCAEPGASSEWAEPPASAVTCQNAGAGLRSCNGLSGLWDQPARGTIRRTGRLLAASIPVPVRRAGGVLLLCKT